MSREPPCWSTDAVSGTVLMEYVRRASPQFVEAELDKLGLLDAADEAAAATLARIARRKSMPRHRLVAMVALAMCAMILVIAQTRHFVPQDDRSQFMRLAGPTPEW